jgi:hypothetical protein
VVHLVLAIDGVIAPLIGLPGFAGRDRHGNLPFGEPQRPTRTAVADGYPGFIFSGEAVIAEPRVLADQS